jgi:predicted RNA-binding protein YlqC (UPF0109 family)
MGRFPEHDASGFKPHADRMAKRSKRISGIAGSLRKLGDIQINDWDFEGLMNKDVRDIEFAKSLRRLGSIRVMEWDFKDVMPAVHGLAHREVDIAGLLRRAADYKVMEWDFRGGPPHGAAPPRPCLSAGGMEALTSRLRDFIRFSAVNLIDEPGHATIKVREIAPGVLRFRLVLVKKDVPVLIGTGGHTAGAIRNIIKCVAAEHGVSVLLEILSHEDEIALQDGASERD